MNTNHQFEATFPATKPMELIKIGDAMSTASRINIPEFKKATMKQGDLIRGIKEDLQRLIKVYEG